MERKEEKVTVTFEQDGRKVTINLTLSPEEDGGMSKLNVHWIPEKELTETELSDNKLEQPLYWLLAKNYMTHVKEMDMSEDSDMDKLARMLAGAVQRYGKGVKV